MKCARDKTTCARSVELFVDVHVVKRHAIVDVLCRPAVNVVIGVHIVVLPPSSSHQTFLPKHCFVSASSSARSLCHFGSQADVAISVFLEVSFNTVLSSIL